MLLKVERAGPQKLLYVYLSEPINERIPILVPENFQPKVGHLLDYKLVEFFKPV